MSLFNLFYRDQHKGATLDEFEHLTSRVSGWALKEHNEDGTHNLRPSGFDFVPIGAILIWPTNTAPSGWLICDGSQVLRTTYAALFALIGTTFGAGDGSTTFNLPDFRQRFPLGKAATGTGSTLAGTGGQIDHTHTVPGLSVPGLSIPGLSVPGLSVSITTSSSGSHNHGGATGLHSHGAGTLNLPAIQTSVTGLNPPTSFTTYDNTIANAISGSTDSTTASISSDGAHVHSVSGSTGTGTTGTGTTGTGTTSASTTGSNNAPFIVVNYIILAGV